jgi:hypothetical protein
VVDCVAVAERYDATVYRRWLATFAVCACSARVSSQSARSIAAPPLFPPGWDHWPIEPRPVEDRPDPSTDWRPTDADRIEFAAVARSCASIGVASVWGHRYLGRDLFEASRTCPRQELERYKRCRLVCEDAAVDARMETWARLTRSVSSSAPAQISPSSSPPVRVPDTFERALRDCIDRVRDSGGGQPARCRFDYPLDDMDFGQRHCDARCARETGGARRDV